MKYGEEGKHNIEELGLNIRNRVIFIMGKSSAVKQKDQKLKWWQLSLLGVAGTIGTGYFLGSGLAISIGGPAVLIAYFLQQWEHMWCLMPFRA